MLEGVAVSKSGANWKRAEVADVSGIDARSDSETKPPVGQLDCPDSIEVQDESLEYVESEEKELWSESSEPNELSTQGVCSSCGPSDGWR